MKYIVFFFFLLLLVVPAGAQVQLPPVFSDNMMLQRDRPFQIWGKAIPGQTVQVVFGSEHQSAVVNPDSSWRVHFGAMPADSRPRTLTVTAGSSSVVVQNILLGDVWLCIGQSNMEFPMMKEMHFGQEVKNSNRPMIRFFNPAYAGKNIYGAPFTDSVTRNLIPSDFYSGQWQVCDSSSSRQMSAVAYYFAKEIRRTVNVPIGLINLSIGGAPLETFIDKEVLKESGQFVAKVNGDWLNNGSLPVWVRERGKQNVGGNQQVPADENGKNHAYKPGFAYTAGIEPLLPYALKGILCYQGESNAQEPERVAEYADLTRLMVSDYRKKWKDHHLPFYFVQLSSIDTIKYEGRLWPGFRNEQRKILSSLTYSGMAVCSDIGARDDVHPVNKKLVGERLARWALNKTYNQDILPSGPLPLSAEYTDGRVVISFQYTGDQLRSAGGEKLKGFSLDGKRAVNAVIDHNKVFIRSGSKPEFVYYGWSPYSDGNLINSAGLPASTFKLNVK